MVEAVDVRGGLPTGVVTLLMTDVEGSTRLWETDQQRAAAVLSELHDLISDVVSRHGGVRPEEQGEGDSTVSAFADASAAVAAALEIQLSLVGDASSRDDSARVRIALHTGEASLRDQRNYQGPTIIRCARLRNLADGGQTVVSDATRAAVEDRLGDAAELRDLGVHRLKDLGRAERVWQLCHPALVNEHPPLRSLDSHPNNLPSQLTDLIGREHQLREVVELLEANRLLTLTGAGGSGKTRLALQLAADVSDSYDGVWWVELSSLRDPTGVAGTIASTLGFHETHDRSIEAMLLEQLRATRTLLVLDNCEQVIDGVAQTLHVLCSALPELRVVATSREPLGVPGEVAWRVPSLDEADAVGLFVDRARRVRPGYAPSPDEREAIERICRRVDGLPLGIELAAARTRMMHPERIAAGLDDRFRLLTGGSRTAMPRQQTLEASVAWSHELLDDSQRTVFRRLAVFDGGFTLEAAEAVAADGEVIDEYAVLELVGQLVDKSLVQLEPGETRYRLLETLRHYARERLLDAGESDTARQRHLDYFLRFAEEAAERFVGHDGPAWLARIDADYENARAALDWANITKSEREMLRLATALTLFWELRGRLPEGDRWFTLALELSSTTSVELARATWGAAHVALYNDDFDKAPVLANAAVELAERCGDDWTRARAFNTKGYARVWFDLRDARQLLMTSIELGRAIGDAWSVADGLKMVTITFLLQEDYDGLEQAACDLEREALQLGNGFFLAWCHACRGYRAMRQGDYAYAREQFDRSLELCESVGDPPTAGLVISWKSEIDLSMGNIAVGRERLERFIAHASATGAHMGLPPALIVLSTMLVAGDELAGARSFASAVASAQTGIPWFAAWSLIVLGAAQVRLGELETVEATLDGARSAASSIGSPSFDSAIDELSGRLAHAQDDLIRAEDLHHAALSLRWRAGLLPGVVDSLEALASLALDQESGEEATRVYAAASAVRDRIGFARWPNDESSYERDLSRARALLGDEVFTSTWAEGVALSDDEAVAYVSRARGERKRPASGWVSLTPTEERVVALVAEGLTNRAIAERLFVAPGTVKVHLSHVFTKLGVATRAELAAEATRRSLR